MFLKQVWELQLSVSSHPLCLYPACSWDLTDPDLSRLHCQNMCTRGASQHKFAARMDGDMHFRLYVTLDWRLCHLLSRSCIACNAPTWTTALKLMCTAQTALTLNTSNSIGLQAASGYRGSHIIPLRMWCLPIPPFRHHLLL